MDYAIVGVIAFLVSIVSGIAGGGGGIVLAPLMLLLGFPPQVVLASSKAGGVGLNAGALSKFLRQKGYINWHWGSLFAGLSIAASLIGTRMVLVLSGQTLRHLIAAVTLVLVIVLFLQRKMGTQAVRVSHTQQIFGVLVYFIIMTLQAGLGSGIGTLLMFILMGMLGLDALHANATKRVAGFVLVTVSFVIFAFSGYVNWTLAACLGGGMLIGGYLGARLAIKHGNALTKNTLLAVSAVMGILVLLHS